MFKNQFTNLRGKESEAVKCLGERIAYQVDTFHTLYKQITLQSSGTKKISVSGEEEAKIYILLKDIEVLSVKWIQLLRKLVNCKPNSIEKGASDGDLAYFVTEKKEGFPITNDDREQLQRKERAHNNWRISAALKK